MAETIKIEPTPEARKLLKDMRTLPDRLLQAIAGAINKENQFTIAHIQRDRMKQNNNKSFPPALHILGIRSGNYRASLNSPPARIEGEKVVSSIGSNLPYPAIHEFGGTIHRAAHSGKVRLREDAHGNLLRQVKDARLAVFARKTHKRAREVEYNAKAYDIRIPARAPVTTGIRDRRAAYDTAITTAINAAFEAK